MTDDERLEQELAALQPRRPSAELKRRVAENLTAMPMENGKPTRKHSWTQNSNRLKTPLPDPHRDRARVFGAALLGGVLAAGLAAIVVWRGSDEPLKLHPVLALEANVSTAFDESLPSIWSFRCALSRPRPALDEVLDKYGAQTLEHKTGGAPGFVFARFNSDMDSLLGEL